MRIGGQPQGLDPQLLADDRVKSQAAKGGTESAVQGQGQAQPVGDANIDQHTLDLIGHSPGAGDEIRTDKVAALKKAIAEGSYQVSAEKIASAMLNEVASRG